MELINQIKERVSKTKSLILMLKLKWLENIHSRDKQRKKGQSSDSQAVLPFPLNRKGTVRSSGICSFSL